MESDKQPAVGRNLLNGRHPARLLARERVPLTELKQHLSIKQVHDANHFNKDYFFR